MNLSPIVDHGYLLGLGDDDHPQYLHLNKAAQTLLQNLAVGGGITIDGVDISAHAANVDAHHAEAHNLASHTTKAHAELTNVTAAQHHARYTNVEAIAAAEGEDPFDHAGDIHYLTGKFLYAGAYDRIWSPNVAIGTHGIGNFSSAAITYNVKLVAGAWKSIASGRGIAIGGSEGTISLANTNLFGGGDEAVTWHDRLWVTTAGDIGLSENLVMAANKTVDGVDISVHAANVSAHHVKTTDAGEIVSGIFNKERVKYVRGEDTGINNATLSPAIGGSIGRFDFWRNFPTVPVYRTVLTLNAYAQPRGCAQLALSYGAALPELWTRCSNSTEDDWHPWREVAFYDAENAKARAWRNGLQVIATGTITIVQLGNESYDPGGNFSTATYRLTAPYSGYYDFSAMAIYTKDHPANNLPFPKVYQLFFYKNNAIRLTNAAGSHSSWGGGLGCVAADIHYLAATDFVDMRVWHNGGVNIELWGEEHSTYMAIHLISKV